MSQFNDPLEAADVWSVAPIFSATGLHPIAEARVDLWLAEAVEQINRELYGSKADLATLLLTAHFLHCDVRDNESAIVGSPTGAAAPTYAGSVTSESVGPVSRSYGGAGGASFTAGGAGAFNDEALATTPWGQRLIALRRTTWGGGAY